MRIFIARNPPIARTAFAEVTTIASADFLVLHLFEPARAAGPDRLARICRFVYVLVQACEIRQ